MNKQFFRGALLSAVGLSLVSASQVFAEVSGRYLSADIGEADLLGIVEKYPKLFWTALILFIVACIAYAIYHLTRRKKHSF